MKTNLRTIDSVIGVWFLLGLEMFERCLFTELYVTETCAYLVG